MVNVFEYQGKELFKKYGITVPASKLIKTLPGRTGLKFPLYLKAQVPTGHRQKLGGVSKVGSYTELKESMLKMEKIDFNGYKAGAFLLEAAQDLTKEFYISISLNRSKRAPVLMISERGGIDIERVDKKYINTYTLNQFIGIPDYVKKDAAEKLGLRKDTLIDELYRLLDSIWSLYLKEDAELVEINPLGMTKSGLVAIDSKIVIDDDALFRHEYLHSSESSDPLERQAEKEHISFVRLPGSIGIIANGAGLTMATIDMIERLGGKAGDFLDLGGTDDPAKVVKAVTLVSKEHPTVLLINIFGGVTKADTVAEGIVDVIQKIKPNFKIFVRLSGFNTERGKKLLAEQGIKAFDSMSDAINAAVKASL